MKRIVLFVLPLLIGCATQAHQPEHVWHPKVVRQSAELSKRKDGSYLFSAEISVSEPYYRIVLTSCRAYYRRYFEDEHVHDQVTFLRSDATLKIKVEFDSSTRYRLNELPARLTMYHRTRQGGIQVLSEWWVLGDTLFNECPSSLRRHGFDSVQSGEGYISPPQR